MLVNSNLPGDLSPRYLDACGGVVSISFAPQHAMVTASFPTLDRMIDLGYIRQTDVIPYEISPILWCSMWVISCT